MPWRILIWCPNGALIACMEYLLENIEWLENDLGEYQDEFLLIDIPGKKLLTKLYLFI